MRDGDFASTRQISTVGSCAGSWDENRKASSSSNLNQQQGNSQQKKPLRTLVFTTLASNCLRKVQTLNPELQRWRSVPVMREGLVPMASARWSGQRYFSADAQPDSESPKKGLPESQIGEELLSESEKNQSSGVGLKLADGETLSPEEEAILKEAEAEFESAQQSKGA